VLALEPESAIAEPPLASTITVAPVAIEVVSLCLLKILALGVIVFRPLDRELPIDLTMRPNPQTSL
jgi:hypothetical protein